MQRRCEAIAVLTVLVTGCFSGIMPLQGDTDANDETETEDAAPEIPDETASEVGISGLRRLSIAEYEQTISDLLGLQASQVHELLPGDTLTPFDNDYTLQLPSEPLIKGLELVAGDIAETVVASQELRAALVPCEPTGVDDAECFAEFIRAFGRRALRRPLREDEVEALAALGQYAVEADSFWAGVDAALRVFLQHPEFVYRVEVGVPVTGRTDLRRLDGFELGARLSYFLLGTTPPDWLLDSAEAGDLDDDDGIAEAARKLLDDPRARTRVERFHELWLGYATLSRDGLFGDMHEETRALVERVVFEEQQPWTQLLTATQTYVSPELAEHYGLPSPGAAAGWVDYGDSGRAGVLSHGTLLSVGAKFGDTSPTQRGLLVRTRLFCQEIPDPPPSLMVQVDAPPPADPDACKHERYNMSREPACEACHLLMDSIGFGLENYDATGAFRTHDAGRPECVIEGEGEFRGVGSFNGPAELAALAVSSGLVEDCVARQLYRFAVGRTELDEHDEALLQRLVDAASPTGGFELLPWIEAYVTSEAFRYRREEMP